MVVSIIMPAFNAERYIAQSVKSVVDQTVGNWELIIVDDGSSDNTGFIIKDLIAKDNRIKYLWQQNGKQGRARNKALKHAIGEYICFLDADDLWERNKLEWQLSEIEKNSVDLIFSDCNIIDEEGEVVEKSLGVKEKVFNGAGAVEDFLNLNRIPILTVMCKRIALEKASYFTENSSIQNAEDYYLWFKMLLNGCSFRSYSTVSASYRVHKNQSTLKDTLATKAVINAIADLQIDNRQLEIKRDYALLKWISRYLERNKNEFKIDALVVQKLSGRWVDFQILFTLLCVLPVKLKRNLFYRYCQFKLKHA